MKILKLINVLLIAVSLACLFTAWADGRAESVAAPYINTGKTGFDAIIIPGASVRGGTVSLSLGARLDKGLELYQSGASDKIIVSGDHGTEEYDEVNAMREYLMKHGIPREDIFMDHAGFDTYATVYRARDIFCVKRAVIVSQGYHNIRAVYIARCLGLELYGENAADPYVNRLRFIREPLARVKAFWEAEVFKPKPKYLGNAIPVSGSGAATDDGLT